MAENNYLSDTAMNWLLEDHNPGVRYLALRDLLELRPDDPELVIARGCAHQQWPIAVLLDQMKPEGYWSEPGPGYSPKYFSTVWSLILLGQLGASVEMDARNPLSCQYFLDHALTDVWQMKLERHCHHSRVLRTAPAMRFALGKYSCSSV